MVTGLPQDLYSDEVQYIVEVYSTFLFDFDEILIICFKTFSYINVIYLYNFLNNITLQWCGIKCGSYNVFKKPR